MDVQIPNSKMRVIACYKNKKRPDLEFYETYGGPVMADQQQDALKQLLGDQKGSVSVGVDISEADYGTGCKVFCSVTLTCDQSQPFVEATSGWAAALAQQYAERHFDAFKAKLIQKGLIKQAPSPYSP